MKILLLTLSFFVSVGLSAQSDSIFFKVQTTPGTLFRSPTDSVSCIKYDSVFAFNMTGRAQRGDHYQTVKTFKIVLSDSSLFDITRKYYFLANYQKTKILQ